MRSILYIISSLKMGGAENLLYTISSNINKNNNYKQTVIYFHDGPIRKSIEDLDIKTYYVNFLFKRYDPRFILNLYKLIKYIKPDIIVTSLWAANLFGIIISYLLKIPVVAILHALPEHEGKFRNLFSFFILRLADKIIAVSDSVYKSANKKFNIKSNKIEIIPNCIDIDLLLLKNKENCINRENLNIPKDSFVFGSVGRFVPVKNYSYLLDISYRFIKKFPNSYLVLIGSGPEYNLLRTKAYNLNIDKNIRFILDEPAYKYYSVLDCFLQPSLHEGLSLALLEAMGFGIPCIVGMTDNSTYNTHDVITHDKDGFVCLHEQIEKYLEKIFLDKSLALSIGKSASKLIKEKYNVNSMLEKYEQVFRKVINK